MSKIILCRGIQGSGKTTWAKQYCKEHPRTETAIYNIVNEFNRAGSSFNKTFEECTIEYRDFFIPLEVCIERDSKRENPIGEEVIRKTYERYKSIIENV